MPFAPAPDFIANGEKPPVFSLPNPAFVYGWIVPTEELLKVIDVEPCAPWTDVDDICRVVKRTLKEEWLAKGYRKSNYNPNVPGAFSVGNDHILIYMVSNNSVEEITKIMQDEDYHAKCRGCMKRTKSMEFPPLWFRSNLKRVPKNLEVLNQKPQANSIVPSLWSIVSFFLCIVLYAVLKSLIFGRD